MKSIDTDTEPVVPLELRRRLTLPLLTLYGLGVTIGAGIYVLVGTTAAKAGIYAPISFLIAAAVVAFTGFSYSELSTRYPVSAGEAAYIRAGFSSEKLTLIVPLSQELLTVLVILLVGLIAAWGIFESVFLAAIFTVIEIAGLGLVIYHGISADPAILAKVGSLLPPFEFGVWSGILSASLLAFFAFIGFEDMANVAEEVVEPHKTLPRGIILTLVIATILYFLVASVVVLTVPMAELTGSAAPLALIFEDAETSTRGAFRLIAIVATTNGILIQVIMASRVIYGLASQKNLPEFFAIVNPVTRTPLIATALIVGIVLFLAYFLPIAKLAGTTSTIVLIVFILVNLALIRLKLTSPPPSGEVFQVPIWVPAMGFITSCILLVVGVLPI